MDAPIGAGGPDVPSADGPPSSKERVRLKLVPRSKPAGKVASVAAPAPASAKKASIFGGGKAHDEFAYEVSGLREPEVYACYLRSFWVRVLSCLEILILIIIASSRLFHF